jgi:sulfotransferase
LRDWNAKSNKQIHVEKNRAWGAPLISLHAVLDLPASVRQQLYFLRFEDLVERPVECMSHIYSWLAVAPLQIDPERLGTQGSPESDSHYCMKFTHQLRSRVTLPPKHDIPERIQARIQTACAWYDNPYYPP